MSKDVEQKYTSYNGAFNMLLVGKAGMRRALSESGSRWLHFVYEYNLYFG
jgi:hypothetical protein